MTHVPLRSTRLVAPVTTVPAQALRSTLASRQIRTKFLEGFGFYTFVVAFVLFCLAPFAFCAASMCRKIFTRGFRRPENFIAIAFGLRQFYRHSNSVVPGIFTRRWMSIF